MNQFVKAFIATGALLFSVHAFAQVGVVTEINGEVTLQRGEEHFALVTGVDLYPGDTIRSGEDAGAQLDMDDGSMISISSNAEITIANYQLREDESVSNATIELLSGWLRFAVAKLRNRDSSYQLSMPTAVLGVRGTEGVVEVSGGGESAHTRIFLEEGEVEIAEEVRKGRLSGQKVRLRAGEFAERRFRQMLLKRAVVPAAFKKRLPIRLKTKLKRRIKLLKKRGIQPKKLGQIMRNKIKRTKLKEQLRTRPEKREEAVKKLKQKKKLREKKKKIRRDKRERRLKRNLSR